MTRQRLFWRGGVGAILAMWLVAGGASAASEVRLEAQVGWSGWIPLNVRIPVRVELLSRDAMDGTLVVDVPIRDPAGPLSFRRPVRLAPGVRHRFTLDIVVPDARKALLVRFIARNGEVTRKEIPLSIRSTVDGVVLVLTREPAGLEHLFDLSKKFRPAYITEAELPGRWQGYAGVVLLVLHDLDAREVRLDQQEALERWVAQGGRLVVTGGESLAQMRGSWIGRMLPADPEDRVSLTAGREFPGLRTPILATILSPRPGAVTRGRIKAQWRWGAGTVTLWGVDLLAPDLRTWDGQGALWQEALTTSVPPVLVSEDIRALLPTSRPVPARVQIWFAILAVAYVLVMRGVLAQAIVRRAGGVLLVAVIAVSALGMYGFGLHVRHVGTVAVQATVVEGIEGTDLARVRSAIALLSPYGGAFELVGSSEASFHPVEAHALTFEGPAVIRGLAPRPGLQIDVRQVLPVPVQGRLEEGADGQRVDIALRDPLKIDEPVLVRHAQVYRLPQITAAFSAPLDPTLWEPIGSQREAPQNLDGRLREYVLSSLARWLTEPSGAVWLVGRIDSRKLSVSGRPMSVETYQVLAVPLQRGGAPP